MKKMSFDTDTAGSTIPEIEEALWNERLYDPDVWSALVAEREALKFWDVRSRIVFSGLLVVVVALSAYIHLAFLLLGAVVCLGFFIWRGAHFSNTRRHLNFLVGSPGPWFNSVAVNKIVAEGKERSPEVYRYIKTVEGAGRRWISGYENQMICRILGTMDREERERTR